MKKALEVVNASKTFDGRPALVGAGLTCAWGEVHALLGENGAGKSTLMNIVCGLYAADEGEVRIDGAPVRIDDPADASALGIGMVHQHFKLVRRFSAAENILLACGPTLGIKRLAEAEAAIREQAQAIGFAVDPRARIEDLSVAEQQRIEIVKVLLLGAKILILDEPTAVLTDQESEAILAFVRRMASQGRAVILITHKLREVTGYSDRVTVMRAGKTVLASAASAGLTQGALARTMVGSENLDIAHPERALGAVRLEATALSVARPGGGRGVEEVSLAVRGGEIYGIAGVGGNGQAELAETLTGTRRPIRGSIVVDGRELAHSSVRDFRRHGVRAVPSDRFRTGLFADLSVYENFAATGVPAGRYGGWALLERRRMRDNAARAIESYQIHGAQPATPARLLSGGNAQKLLLARELDSEASILVAHSPTRGLDVNAYKAIHRLLLQAAERGTACVLISEDLEEVLTLSTTVAVISRGRIAGRFAAREATREKIGQLMLGHA